MTTAPSSSESAPRGSALLWVLSLLLLLVTLAAGYLWYRYAEQGDLLTRREAELTQLEYSFQRLQGDLERARERTDASERRLGEMEQRLSELGRQSRETTTLQSRLEELEQRNAELERQSAALRQQAEGAGAKPAPAQAEATPDGAAPPSADCSALAEELERLQNAVPAAGTDGAERLAELEQGLVECRALAQELEERQLSEARMAEAFQDMIRELQDEIRAKEVAIESIAGQLKIDILGSILFKPGSRHITPQGLQVLERLLPSLAKLEDRQVYVTGHTDDVDISADYQRFFPSNWELSAARAAAVVRFITEHSAFPPQRLAAVGFGPYQPEADNETPEGRARNRRVELLVGGPVLVER